MTVRDVLVATVVLLAGLMGLFVATGFVADVTRRRRRALFDRSRQAFGQLLFADDEAAAVAAQALRSLPPSMVLDAGKRLVTDLAGQAGPRICELVASLGHGRRIRRLMRARRWRRRAQGASLAALLLPGDPGRTALLLDHHPTVRARAVEGLDGDDVGASVEMVVQMLDDPNEAVRLSAQQALIRSGASATAGLEKVLVEGRGRALILALECAGTSFDPRLLPVVQPHLYADDPRVRATALRAMPLTSVEDSVLRTLLEDADPEVRAVAALAVGRAGCEHLAAAVGRLLDDPAWVVRSAAGSALADLGPAGLMVLRLALDHEDRYARDMARVTLDAVAALRGGGIAATPPMPDPTVDDWDHALGAALAGADPR